MTYLLVLSRTILNDRLPEKKLRDMDVKFIAGMCRFLNLEDLCIRRNFLEKKKTPHETILLCLFISYSNMSNR